MEEKALQDVFKVHCFGCGALNEHGLQIKSHWEGDELVCRWQPKPQHIGHPGIVYGGMIASIVDCHAMWAAMATASRDAGREIVEGGPPPPAFVTGKLSVSYLQPAAIDRPLELRARVTEKTARRANVTCRVLQGDVECAVADVIAVRLPG